VVVVVE
jgi:diacylglycerol kinase